MARKIADVLLQLFVLGITGFLVLVLVNLRDRYDQKITAPDSDRIEGRNLALMPGLPSHPDAGAKHARHAVGRSGELAPPEVLRGAAKPVSTDAAGNANQGMSVALSADGNTAIVGGPGPNNADRDRSPSIGPAGAAWIFTRRGACGHSRAVNWLARPTHLEGGCGLKVPLWRCPLTATPPLSAARATIRTTGATWVFVRSGGVWSQQGAKLVGTGPHRASESGIPLGQGMSVALSADGDTAIVGGWRAEGSWVFTRRGGIWSQQGKQLIGSGAVGSARQGMSVALSADGNTAIVGGWSDHDRTGAAWVFTRSSGIWSQQGKKLVGSGAVGGARQGMSSRCPPTATPPSSGARVTVRGIGRCPSVLDRRAQHGYSSATKGSGRNKARGSVSSSAVGTARQGKSVALSADGNVAIVGGLAGDDGVGTATVFTRNGTA